MCKIWIASKKSTMNGKLILFLCNFLYFYIHNVRNFSSKYYKGNILLKIQILEISLSAYRNRVTKFNNIIYICNDKKLRPCRLIIVPSPCVFFFLNGLKRDNRFFGNHLVRLTAE